MTSICRECLAAISLLSASSLSFDRATKTRCRPRAANARAKLAPMPLEAPVIRAKWLKVLETGLFSLGEYGTNNPPWGNIGRSDDRELRGAMHRRQRFF